MNPVRGRDSRYCAYYCSAQDTAYEKQEKRIISQCYGLFSEPFCRQSEDNGANEYEAGDIMEHNSGRSRRN